MKRLIISLLSIMVVFNLLSQNDYKAIRSIDAFKKKLTEVSASISSIESDFVQTKYIDILSENVTSKGKFYYKKADKIRLEYTSPVSYLIVINGKKIKIVSDGKTNTYEIGSNPTMKQMNQLITACMTGNLDGLSSDYQLQFMENNSFYWLVVKPLGAAKNYMKSIDIFMDKNDLSVQKLKMTEASGDFTEYSFINKKTNSNPADEKFSTK